MHLSSEHIKPLTCALDHNIGTFSKYPPPHSRPVIILRSLISNYTSWRLDKTMKLYLASIILFLRAGDHNASAQWAHQLNSPCGRDSTSDSVLMCGAPPCALRATIETSTRVKGGGRPRTEVMPSIQSNSLFKVYATNGPDLTIDMCMAREGIVHSSSPLAFATNCGSDAQSHTKDWWCGSMFTSDSCEFEEEHFNTNWTCRDDICLCGCTNEIQSTGVVEGHRTLLRYDTSVLNVGDTAWTLGSRSILKRIKIYCECHAL